MDVPGELATLTKVLSDGGINYRKYDVWCVTAGAAAL